MAEYPLTDSRIFWEEFNFTTQFNSGNIDYGVEELDATVFTDTARVRRAGLYTVGINLAGFVDLTDDGIDEQFFNDIGGANQLITICPESAAEGDISYFLRVNAAQYQPGGSVGELLGFQFTANAEQQLVRGQILQTPDDQETASGSSSTGYQLGALDGTGDPDNTIVAQLHVFQFNGTSLDVDLRRDDAAGMATPIVHASFAQATGVTSEQITSTTSSSGDDFWDVDFTFVGTSVTFIVSAGII